MEVIIPVFCSFSKRELSFVESWLIPSLMRQKNIRGIELYLVNYTGSEERIYAGPRQRGIVTVTELNKGSACGFGEAHNFAFSSVNPSPYFMIVNPDVYLHELCAGELAGRIREEGRNAIVEARQLPYEDPKEYDPETGETPWAVGCCVMVNADFFRAAGGFDELFWMYAEDVDLSWRAWLAGCRVIYHPPAVAYHYTGRYFQYNACRYYNEHFWSARNFLFLLYKYWGRRGIRRGMRIMKKVDYPREFKDELTRSFLELKERIPSHSLKTYRRGVWRFRDRIMVAGFTQYDTRKDGNDV